MAAPRLQMPSTLYVCECQREEFEAYGPVHVVIWYCDPRFCGCECHED